MQKAKTKNAMLIGTSGIVTVILIAAAIATVTGTALANPDIAKSTGKPCTACHTTPPALNSDGQKYKDSHKK
jgi:hypothetical protein